MGRASSLLVRGGQGPASLAAIGEPGAVASEIARDAGVDVSLLYRWRRHPAMDSASPGFVPVQVSPDPGEAG